ncbi:MAG: outer membrane protein assembly factor BamD [Pseudomonadales bacterium]|jgi:outer membrane protein assembly factor BamD
MLKINSSLRNTAVIFGALLFLSACSSNDEEQDIESTELAFYESAQNSLRSANYSLAVSKLQLLEARFPFGRYAEQAQLEIIYAYYRSAQAEAARAAADRFIRLHPRHPNVDYAYYLKGLASFEEDENFMAKLFPLDPSTRDPGAARDSFNDFAQLIRRFPNSEYAPDAQKRMQYLKNLLAASEIHVARYYIYRGAYVAAANRGRYVFENMQGTGAVPDALAIMVEAYQLLGMEHLASDALLVLASNYPEHDSLTADGEFRDSKSVKSNERSWVNIITFGLMG